MRTHSLPFLPSRHAHLAPNRVKTPFRKAPHEAPHEAPHGASNWDEFSWDPGSADDHVLPQGSARSAAAAHCSVHAAPQVHSARELQMH